MDWRIYYADETTYSSDDGMPDLAPAWGVIVILVPEWSLWFGKDWYWYRDGEWFGGDWFGLLDHLLHERAATLIFAGRTVPDATYKRILARAIADRNRLNNG